MSKTLERGYYDVFMETCAKYPANIAVRCYVEGVFMTYTYSELYGVCEYLAQNLLQLRPEKGVIGIVSTKNIIVPCLLAAAHKCSSTFMFLDPSNDIFSLAQSLKFKVLLRVYEKSKKKTGKGVPNKQPDKSLTIFNLVIDIYILKSPDDSNGSKNVIPHSFIASTSGSTGDPKRILVPVQCLKPNIDDLTSLFDITQSDIIYFSTPLTFDPSMVEILLACTNGASLLIAPENVDILFTGDEENAITVWQTTPSKFFQYSHESINKHILCFHSKLRVLAFGGEPLNGVKKLKKMKNINNKTKIFTLYGVTEMSCWACAAELDLNKCNTDFNIPLGGCLSETQMTVRPERLSNGSSKSKFTGKIILASKTRNCVVLNKPEYSDNDNNVLTFIDTGDLGEVSNGIIYYRGRRDDVVKRFGHKINLAYIQSVAMHFVDIKSCSCIWLPKPRLLVVYYTSNLVNNQQFLDYLKSKLAHKYWPDRIVKVDNMPVNIHGKLAKSLLLKMYEKSFEQSKSIDIVPEPALKSQLNMDVECIKPQKNDALSQKFLRELQAYLNPYITYEKVKDKKFIEIGGSSFLAITLCNKLAVTDPQISNFLLPQLICEDHTIGEIVCALSNTASQVQLTKGATKRALTNEENLKPAVKKVAMNSTSSITNESININLIWKFNCGKCMDSSPTVISTGVKLLVTAGSHSGKIVVINVLNGELVGEINMKSRIEASVYCCQLDPMLPPYGVVGTYKGTISCFDVENCKENWRINIGSMIKSKATSSNGFLYIASYDGCVRCINLLTGTIHTTIEIGMKPISANLVVAKDEYVFVGTQSGICACVHTITNAVVWRSSLPSPVFASPVVYDQDKFVIFISVTGKIECRTVEKGNLVWKYNGAVANVFSSIYVKPCSERKFKMLFGCHDSHLYCLQVHKGHASLLWKKDLGKPIFSTPYALDKTYVLAASNDGTLHVLNHETGNIVGNFQLPGETFSSPKVYNEYIFIGCRSDNLFCLKYSVNK